MLRFMLPVLLATVVSGPAAGQANPFQPAEALDRFKPMLGHWEGGGTLRMAPDAPGIEWKGRATVKRVLDGHFVQKDTRITLANGQTVEGRTIYGYDRTRKRFTAFSINATRTALGDTFWTDDRKLVSSRIDSVEGRAVSERFVASFGDGEVTLRSVWSIDGGASFEHMTGRLTRKGDGAACPPVSALEPGPVRSLLGRMAGAWRFRGEMSAAPGAPAVKISGREVVVPCFGGTALRCETVGDPTPGFPRYRGHCYFAFDPVANCIVNVSINNMGEWHVARGYAAGEDRVVFVSSANHRGTPTALRSTMTFKDGAIQAATHQLAGGREAECCFSGTLTREAAN